MTNESNFFIKTHENSFYNRTHGGGFDSITQGNSSSKNVKHCYINNSSLYWLKTIVLMDQISHLIFNVSLKLTPHKKKNCLVLI